MRVCACVTITLLIVSTWIKLPTRGPYVRQGKLKFKTIMHTSWAFCTVFRFTKLSCDLINLDYDIVFSLTVHYICRFTTTNCLTVPVDTATCKISLRSIDWRVKGIAQGRLSCNLKSLAKN